MDPASPSISDRPDASRYEAQVEGALAGFVDYRWMGGRRVLIHTEVMPAFEGRGVGSALARNILEEAIATGTRVTVKCPFIRTYVERHPAYAVITTPLPDRTRSGSA